jgi:hypothetical protein
MRALDTAFMARVRETTCGLAGIGFLALVVIGASPAALLCFAVGVGLGLLVWRCAEVFGTRLCSPDLGRRDIAPLIGLYLGKYAVAAVSVWLLCRLGWMEPVSLSLGFGLPGLTVLLKAFGWLLLPAEAEPAARYSRFPALAACALGKGWLSR